MTVTALFRPGMRGYLLPLAAGLLLVGCAFFPWVVVDGLSLVGFPDTPALWVIGLGGLAAVLAFLSLVTRKNSRHPLLIVGLLALGVMFLSWRILPRQAADRASMVAQAYAIVDGVGDEKPAPIAVAVGSGIYLGFGASLALVLFGLTIVVKTASRVYDVADQNDDV